jgi:hypothetical protein
VGCSHTRTGGVHPGALFTDLSWLMRQAHGLAVGLVLP